MPKTRHKTKMKIKIKRKTGPKKKTWIDLNSKKAQIMKELYHNPQNLTQTQIAKKHNTCPPYIIRIIKEMKQQGIQPTKKRPETKLNSKKAQIMKELHYNSQNLTQRQIAKKHNFSPQRIQQRAKEMKQQGIKIKFVSRLKPAPKLTKKQQRLMEKNKKKMLSLAKNIALRKNFSKEEAQEFQSDIERLLPNFIKNWQEKKYTLEQWIIRKIYSSLTDFRITKEMQETGLSSIEIKIKNAIHKKLKKMSLEDAINEINKMKFYRKSMKQSIRGKRKFPEGKLTFEIAEDLLKAEEINRKQKNVNYYREINEKKY